MKILRIAASIGYGLLCGLFGWQFGKSCGVNPQVRTKVESPHIPTLSEIQRMVGAKDDGIYGPETKRLWDKALNNQYAYRIKENR